MSKSILVLDESSVIHGLIDSALEVDGLTLHHEFNPGKYVERANTLMPDLILIGNSDTDPEYNICRSIKGESSLAEVPMVLLAGSKEGLTREQLDQMQVAGVVRKPFEASDLQQQVSKHLDLVELVGAAFEYQQSQKTGEEATNPLANLDVLDEEVLGMLKQDGPSEPAEPSVETAADVAPEKGVAAAPLEVPEEGEIVDDQVLAETLEPERAFEIIEETPESEPSSEEKFDTLETFDGEFPESTTGAAAESDLEELGADDLLEEEAPEETILAPEGFDQSLEGDATPAGTGNITEDISADITADIEVELPESLVDMEGIDQELSGGEMEMFESEVDTEAPEPPSPTDYEESVPDSVRDMMDLKPVFTLEQEESASQDEEGGLSFDPEAGEAEEIQSELDNLTEIGLEDGAIVDQEIELVDDAQAESLQHEAPPLEEAPAEPSLEAGDDLPPLDPEILDEPKSAEPPPIEEPVVGEDSSSMFRDDAGDEDEVPVSESQEDELSLDSLEEDVVLDDLPTPKGEEDDEDFFREEYLGDEEIDEEQIISAEEELEATEQPELSQEDEKELDQMLTEDQELVDLDDIPQEEVLASEAIEEIEEEEAEIKVDLEEEELIQVSIDADREAEVKAEEMPADALEELPPQPDVDAVEEPLFERNFNALEEEGPAEISGEAPGETAEEESWELKETESGLTLPAEDGEPVEGEMAADDLEPAPSSGNGEEFITLGKPIGDDLEEPSPTADGADGEAEEEEEEEETWSPDSPPGFIPKPGEDFPKETIEDPPVGSHLDPEEGEQSPMPRHDPEEVLEDPDSLDSVLDEESEAALEEPLEMGGVEEETLDEELSAVGADDAESAPSGEVIEEAFEPLDTGEPLESTEPIETMDSSESMEPIETMDSSESMEPIETMDSSESMEPAAMDAPTQEEPISLEPEPSEPEPSEPEPLETMATGASEEEGMDGLAATLGADRHEDAPEAEAETDGSAGDEVVGGEFDDLFSSLQNEIAANPEGERIDDILRSESLRDQVAKLEFSLPQDENPTARAHGLYALPGDGEEPSAFPSALQGSGAPPPAAGDEPRPEIQPLEQPESTSALSLLDEDIRAKLGQVLDEIISISVRRAVQEEMPKIVERIAREN